MHTAGLSKKRYNDARTGTGLAVLEVITGMPIAAAEGSWSREDHECRCLGKIGTLGERASGCAARQREAWCAA